MAWSIAEVARESRVTSRTLRHYDRIGLLAPAYTAADGRRFYEREQLLRLQRVLLLRELGLGLAAIGQVLDGERNQLAALRQHEQWLVAERDRLDRLAATVARTLSHLTEGDSMTATQMFDGFAGRRAQLEEEMSARYGEGVRRHFRCSEQATKDWGQTEYLDAQQQTHHVEARILDVMRSGAAPDSPAALDAMAEHHAFVSQFWRPDRESYTGLGQHYVDAPEFRERYDAIDPAFAEYLRDATAAYAEQRLS